MTIYGTGYRTLEYEPVGMRSRLWPIATNEFRAMFRPRFGVWSVYLTILICCFPILMRIGIMAVRFGVAQLGMDAPFERAGPRFDPLVIEFYLSAVVSDSFFAFVIVTCLVSCRAIAKDRVTDALEIYWTRGITPAGYFLAKWTGSFLLLGTLFVAFPLLVWIIGIFMAPDWTMFTTTVGFVPRLLFALTVFTAVLSYLAVAFSAVATNPNVATVLWLLLLIGSEAIGQILARALRGEWWFKAISPWESARRIGEWIAGVSPRHEFEPATAVAFLSIWVIAVTLWMLRRLRLVEAVA